MHTISMTTCVPIERWPFATDDICSPPSPPSPPSSLSVKILGVDQAKELGAPPSIRLLCDPDINTNLPVRAGMATLETVVQVSCVHVCFRAFDESVRI